MKNSHESGRRKIGILGGSFDPVHFGHLEMAKAAKEAVGLESVVFLPCYVSPFKEKTGATAEQRHEMLKIALVEMGYEWATVSDYELNRPGPSYSWQTAEHFSKQRQDVDWHWIAGTDQWAQIDKWAEPEILRELLHFIILNRAGVSAQEREGWRHTSVAFDHPASSTAIRANPEERSNWLPRGVLKFIRENGLYGDNKDTE